ncbi:MAG: hypothetical protein ACNA8W_20230 [Bradymonadaceae bacterium]
MDEEAVDAAVTLDILQARYAAMLQNVQNLPEIVMKGAAVEGVVKDLPVDEAVWCLDQLIRGALWGDEPAMEAMLATSMWLIHSRERDDYDLFKSLFEAAYTAERKAVVYLLRDAPPQLSLTKGKRLPEVRLPLQRDVSVGERRMLAAGPQRQFLERLLLDSNPLVIRKLLGNPHLRQQDVLIVATRRPTTPELLLEVALAVRWFQNSTIREALALNPFSRTGLVLKILPSLHIRALRMLAFSGDLHPLVSESARLLVELREERTAPWRV